MEGSRPLSGVIMSLSDIYSATSHLPTRTVHQYPYSPRFSTASCLRIKQVGVDEESTMFDCESTEKTIIHMCSPVNSLTLICKYNAKLEMGGRMSVMGL